MRLVIDTNRIIAGLLRSSVTRRILFNPAYEFYAPEYILTEIRKHREYLMGKAHLSSDEFDLLLSLLFERVTLVAFEEFAGAYPHALGIMEKADPDDAPFLAVGIALSLDGIWTEDKDFQNQDVLPVFTNRNLEENKSPRHS
jgi:predicted nucleic acid-binding protein